MENIWRASVVLFCLRCQVNGSFLIMFLSVIQGENPSVQSRQLYALSYAWSSNLLDYLTTLALIQSNNGEPNWGPNHATSTQLSYWIGLAPLALTSHSSLVQNPGRLHKCPMWIHQLITFLSMLSRPALHADVKNPLMLFVDFRFLPLTLCRWSVFCVGAREDLSTSRSNALWGNYKPAKWNGNLGVLQKYHLDIFYRWK